MIYLFMFLLFTFLISVYGQSTISRQFTYGFNSYTVPTGSNSISISPFNTDGLSSFKSDQPGGVIVDINSGTLTFDSPYPQEYKTYVISASSTSGGSVSTSFQVRFVAESKGDVVRYLSIGYFDSYVLFTGVPVFLNNYLIGTPTSCRANGTLPPGLVYDQNGLTGIPTVVSTTAQKITFQCSNEVSDTNIVEFLLPVVDTSSQISKVKGWWATYYRYTGGNGFECNSREIYNAFHTAGAVIEYQIIEPNWIKAAGSGSPVSDGGSTWPVTEGFGATYIAYMSTVAGFTEISLTLTGGGWLYINGELVINARGCNTDSQKFAANTTLLSGWNYVVFHYFTKTSSYGFDIRVAGNTVTNFFFPPTKTVSYTPRYALKNKENGISFNTVLVGPSITNVAVTGPGSSVSGTMISVSSQKADGILSEYKVTATNSDGSAYEIILYGGFIDSTVPIGKQVVWGSNPFWSSGNTITVFPGNYINYIVRHRSGVVTTTVPDAIDGQLTLTGTNQRLLVSSTGHDTDLYTGVLSITGTINETFTTKSINIRVYSSSESSVTDTVNIVSIDKCDVGMIRTEVSVTGYSSQVTGELVYRVEDASGRVWFGSTVDSETGTFKSGRCLPLGIYYVKGSYQSDSTIAPSIIIYIDNVAAKTFGLSGTVISLSFSASTVVCREEDGFKSVPVGGSSIKNCDSGMLGSMSKKCIDSASGPVWGTIFSTCHNPSAPYDFNYGTSQITLGLANSLILKPRYMGDVTEFTVNHPLPENCSIDPTTGIITLVSSGVLTATNYEIRATLSLVVPSITVTTNIEITIVEDIRTFDNLIGLSIIGSGDVSFPVGAPVNYQFKLESGSASICASFPPLPDELGISIGGITGKLTRQYPDTTHLISCDNGFSKSNSISVRVYSYATLIAGTSAYFSKITAGSIGCSGSYNVFTTENSRIGFSYYGGGLGAPDSNTLVPWSVLNYDYISNYIATYDFYIMTESRAYKFGIGANKGAWLSIDGSPLIDNGGCHQYLIETGDIVLTAGYHHFEVNYVSTSSHRGLQIYWNQSSTLQLIDQNRLFYRPPSNIYYPSKYMTFSINNQASHQTIMFYNTTKPSGCLASPRLPSGLTVNNDGIISGQPTVHTQGYYSIHKIDCGIYNTRVYIEILDVTNVGTFSLRYTGSSSSLNSNIVQMFLGRSISITVSTDGDVSRYSIIPTLPSGFTFNENTGTLSGTCIKSSTTNFIVGAVNGGLLTNQSFTLSCSDICSTGNPIGVSVHNSQNLDNDYQFYISSTSSNDLISKPSSSANAFYTYCLAQGLISFSGSNKNLQPLQIKIYLLNQELTSINTPSGGGVLSTSFYKSFNIALQTFSFNAIGGTDISVMTNNLVDIRFTVTGHYTTVTIDPQLPTGIKTESSPGLFVIRGYPIFRMKKTTFKMTVKQGSVQSSDVTFSITVTDCYSQNQYPVTIYYKTGMANITTYSWKFKSSLSEILTSKEQGQNIETSNFVCSNNGTFTLHLINTNGKRWDTGTYVRVVIADIDLGYFYKVEGSDIVSVNEQIIQLTDISFAIDPLGIWNFISSYPGDSWIIPDYNITSSWTSTTLNNLTTYNNFNTLYLRYIIPQNTNRNALGITIRFRHIAGCVLFINGVELYRANVGDKSIGAIQFADSKFETMTAIKLFLPKSLLYLENNILSIAFFKLQSDSNDFDLSMLANYEVTSKDCVDVSGEGSVINYSGAADSNFPVSNAFDLNYRTNWVEKTSTSGNQAWVTYIFGDHTYAWFDTYGIRSTLDASKNKDSNPRRISLSANDGIKDYFLGDYEFNVVASNQPLTKTLFDHKKIYNSITMTILDRVASSADTAISEVIIQACHRVYCSAEGDFPNTMQNTNAEINCPLGYTGNRYRYCPNDWYPTWEDEDISQCTPGPPVNLFYPKAQYQFNKTTAISEPIRPNITTHDPVTYRISPTLPAGININSVGVIDGTPSEKSSPTLYTITASNGRGSTSTVLYISVTAPECDLEAFWNYTEGNKVANISCPNGYTGYRVRLCPSTLQWQEPDETNCVFTKTLDPQKGEVFVHYKISVASILDISLTLLFMDYIRYYMIKNVDTVELTNSIIFPPSILSKHSVDFIVVTSDDIKDQVNSGISNYCKGSFRDHLSTGTKISDLTIGCDFLGFINYKPDSSVNVLAIVFASVFGVILLALIGLCIFFRLRSSSKRKSAAATKNSSKGGSGNRGGSKTAKTAARSVKL